MQAFSPLEYLKIDIANQFGLDRLVWQDRIHWTEDNASDLKNLDTTAKYPILFRKATRALQDVLRGAKSNHIMGLDATASGIQIMAAMSGCVSSAETVNLTNTGKREDLYASIASVMSNLTGSKITRDVVKPAVMTFFYGSKAVPKQVFGEGEYLLAFYNTMLKTLPGPYSLMELFQSFWNPTATEYTWTLPDDHVARVPVVTTEEKGLEIDEENHLRFHYRAEINKAQPKGRALAANIVHSIDGWICREMVRRADIDGFWMAPIHDCFYASPKYMNHVRINYRDILAEVSIMNLVSDILTQIADRPVSYQKINSDLHIHIYTSDYSLS